MAATTTKKRRWIWLLVVAAMALDAYVVWLTLARSETPVADAGWPMLVWVFTICGALIVSRTPGNVVGWLLLTPGMAGAVANLAFLWLISFDTSPEAVTPLLWAALFLYGIGWIFLIFPVFNIMLTFPTGRLPSRRWRWVIWMQGIMLAVFIALSTTGPVLEFAPGGWTVPNPIGLSPDSIWDGVFDQIWGILLAILALGSVASLIQRYRKSGTVERLQLKWFLLAVAFFGVTFSLQAAVFTSDEGPTGIVNALFGISFALIPVAIAIAILRFKLFEIDRIVSRTVSYALVVGLLAAVFFGIVALLTTMLDAENELTIAASTLVVFALFNPLRKRVQGMVDRRFNRSRYDSERVIEGFVDTLRSQLDSDQVVAGWVGVVNQTMQPSTVGVWLR